MSRNIKDARMVIRQRQNQKAVRGGRGGGGRQNQLREKVVDARMILKQKMGQKKQFNQIFTQRNLNRVNLRNRNQQNLVTGNLGNRVQQNFSRGNIRNRLQRFVKKGDVNNRIQLNRQNMFSRQAGNRQRGGGAKHVIVGRAGMLKVTSRAQQRAMRRDNEHQMNIDGKCIVSDMSGITVTMRNKPSGLITFNDPMEEDDDDLEKISLQDLTEMKHMKSLPSHRFYNVPNVQLPSSTSHSMPFLNRIRGTEKTMIADTVASSSLPVDTSWKVLVTNLHPSVTQDDILELFGSVGTMKSADLVRPGLAIVEYYTKRDAYLACDSYHNRLLDGQPMQCTVENESQSRTPVTMRLGEKYITSAPSSSHYARQTASSIFSQSSGKTSIGSSRGVEFTVKVP